MEYLEDILFFLYFYEVWERFLSIVCGRYYFA